MRSFTLVQDDGGRVGLQRSDKRDINKKQKIPSRIFPKIEYNTPVFAFCGGFGRDLLKKEK